LKLLILAGASRLCPPLLLKHKSLAAGQGLWIAPCEAVHSFFMKFPIDVIYPGSKETRPQGDPQSATMAALGMSDSAFGA
jgi:hypothetical protein